MRSLLVLIVTTTVLAACSSQTTAPAPQAATPAAQATPAAPAAAKMPQCYNGDAGKFVDVGTAANISGVNVTCEKTADGKSAQWMGKKH